MLPEIKKELPAADWKPRKRRGIYEDPLQHLWAISYSDVLMVVMTFFIFYFSISENVNSRKLLDLVGEINFVAKKDQSPELLRKIASQSDQDLIQEVVGQRLVVHFPADIYAPGQYQVSARQQELLRELLQSLEPHRDRLQLTLVGHADKIPVAKSKSVVDSNLVLSTLRAARAAEFVMLQGWLPERVFAKGDGEFARSTRSLSVQIELVNKSN